jgi:Large ribosomal RNA subunit accumulation protein YceD
MTGANRPWSVPVRLDEVPETGLHIDLEADGGMRAAVAATAGVNEVPQLTAAFDVTRYGRDGLRVVGTVSARVLQTCVVTLDPVENEIAEQVDLVFVPPSALGAMGSEVTLGAEAIEPPEPMVDGVVDLGAIATEFLMLGVDPYPRKPGAVFEPPQNADAGSHPFAALAALRSGRDRGRS